MATLPLWELSVNVVQLVGLRGTLAVPSVQGHRLPCHRSDGPIRVFFQASCSWHSEGLFGRSFSIAPPIQALRGLPCLGLFSVFPRVRHTDGPLLTEVLLCSSAHHALKGALWVGSYPVLQCLKLWWASLSIVQLRMLACVESLWWWLHPLHVTQQYRFVSMAARLSSTGISHHNLLPHIPSIRLSEGNSSPRRGIAPQSRNSSSQPLPLPGDQCSCPECVWLCKDCLILLPFRLPQISCFTLSLKRFSSDSDNCRAVGIRPLLQFPHLSRAGPVLLTLLFFSRSSFILPSFAWLYIFFSTG